MVASSPVQHVDAAHHSLSQLNQIEVHRHYSTPWVAVRAPTDHLADQPPSYQHRVFGVVSSTSGGEDNDDDDDTIVSLEELNSTSNNQSAITTFRSTTATVATTSRMQFLSSNLQQHLLVHSAAVEGHAIVERRHLNDGFYQQLDVR